MYRLLRSLLFQLPAEKSHDLTIRAIARLGPTGLLKAVAVRPSHQPCEVMGLRFKNPVGLAAGLDKNGDCIDGMADLGFGFIEIGTVTPRPQPGNPQPRLFRIPEKQAIINRMGFNNRGLDYLISRVEQSRYRGILGINIGKNFDTPIERAADDYLLGLRGVYHYASYITVNISSPNTPGLRKLQFGDSLKSLLATLKQAQLELAAQYERYVPIAVKVAPDMTDEEVKVVAASLLESGMDGVIATNTTLSRHGVEGLPNSYEQGGLSGAPLQQGSTELIRKLAVELGTRMPIIGVGGIVDAASAAAKIAAGASLVQIYSGFIYRGPTLVREAAEGVYQARMQQA